MEIEHWVHGREESEENTRIVVNNKLIY